MSLTYEQRCKIFGDANYTHPTMSKERVQLEMDILQLLNSYAEKTGNDTSFLHWVNINQHFAEQALANNALVLMIK